MSYHLLYREREISWCAFTFSDEESTVMWLHTQQSLGLRSGNTPVIPPEQEDGGKNVIFPAYQTARYTSWPYSLVRLHGDVVLGYQSIPTILLCLVPMLVLFCVQNLHHKSWNQLKKLICIGNKLFINFLLILLTC